MIITNCILSKLENITFCKKKLFKYNLFKFLKRLKLEAAVLKEGLYSQMKISAHLI